MIYLDYCATTPIDNEVLDTYMRVTKNFFANTSSLHKLGQESNYMYERAVGEIKDILNVKNHDIVFTSNATEANNLAIFGIVNKYKSGKIITSKMEHPSVFEVMKSLQTNFEVVFLDVDKNGLVDIEQLRKELTKDTILVSVMWVNNIIGTVQKIKDIIEILKAYPKTKLHVDAVQGICKIVPDFNFNDIDAFTFSTHKFYGPKGIGGLVFKHGLELEKRLYGSSAQFNVKPGTFDLSLIVATAKAFKIFYPQALKHQEHVKKIFMYLYDQLKRIDNIIINTPLENISYYALNVSIPSVNGETLVHILEQSEIYVSTGSACSSKLKKPEKTIYAMTKDESLSLSSLRMSFSHLTTFEEINKLIESLKRL
jgi:cysteine desulfurase